MESNRSSIRWQDLLGLVIILSILGTPAARAMARVPAARERVGSSVASVFQEPEPIERDQQTPEPDEPLGGVGGGHAPDATRYERPQPIWSHVPEITRYEGPRQIETSQPEAATGDRDRPSSGSGAGGSVGRTEPANPIRLDHDSRDDQLRDDPTTATDGWPTNGLSTTGPVPPPGIERGERGVPALLATDVVLDVPAYIWHNGCGPTAAGMVLGYWDRLGFGYLVPGNADTQTPEVNAMISSAGNWNDYCLPIEPCDPNCSPPDPVSPDRSEPPAGDEHSDDCVADFMKTSQSAHNLYYGWSWMSDVDDALEDYVQLVAPEYSASAKNRLWGWFGWDDFRAEIDDGHPVVLLVDTNGDEQTDHIVTAIGYSEDGGTRKYVCRDTWDTGVHEFDFAGMANGQPWGIYEATFFEIDGVIDDIRPENLALGQLGLVQVDILAGQAGEYKVAVWDDDGWTAPEWDWSWTESGVVPLNTGDQHTFTFPTEPTSTSEGFEFWLYRKDFLGLFLIIEKIEHTLTAAPADTTPPTVVSYRHGTTPGTNIHTTFSEDMDDSTFTNSTVTISGSSSGSHPCAYSFDQGSFELTINPTTDFTYGETVNVTVGTGVEDLAGNNMTSPYSFIFTIESEPGPDPTSLNVSATLDPSSNVPAYSTVHVNGTVYYNTDDPVPVGTVDIDTGENIYTAAISGGSFSRDITAPSSSRNIAITADDNEYSLTETIYRYISILPDQGGDGYTLHRTTTCRDVQSSDPYDPIYETEFFRRSDSRAMVWVHLTDLYRPIRVKWEFYEPDGTLHRTETSSWSDDPQDYGYDYWEWWKFWAWVDIDGYLASYRPGSWTVEIYIDDGSGWDYKESELFTIGYEFTEHRMAKDVEPSDPYMPITETNVFYQTDVKALTWANADNVVEGLDVKWEFFEPNGSEYADFTYQVPDPGIDMYYEWYRFWGWIDINGTPAENKTGDWKVDVFVRDAGGAYEKIYTDYFQILESPSQSPNVSATASPSSPIETQSIILDVSATDNTYLQRVTLYWNDGSLHSQTWDNIYASSFSQARSIGSYSGGQQIEYWAVAWDTTGNQRESEHQTLTVSPETVSTPSVPTGETVRQVGQSGSYTTGGSTTNLGHSVQYQFDWGDGQQSAWGSATQTYSWSSQGTYLVKSRARCQIHTNRVSDWSTALVVTVDSTAPVVEITTNSGNDFTTDQSQIVLEGIAYDPDPASGLASVAINTGDINENTLSNWRFTVDLAEGPNTLVVTAVDNATNQGEDAIVITQDYPPPNAPSNLNATTPSLQAQIDLVWQDNSSDESDFHIERSPNGSTGWTEIGTVGADVTSYSDTGLDCGTTYYYRVRAYRASDDQFSDYSNVDSTTTQACPFSKTSPTNGATEQPTNPTLSWDSSVGATSYEYCIDTTDNDFCDGSWTSTGSNTSVGLSGLDSGITYYWQVRARNAAGTTEANSGTWWHFTTQVGLPGAFSKSSPTDGAPGQPTNPTLSWGSSSGAESYEYCIDTTNNSTCDGSWTNVGSNTSVGLSGLDSGITYYWQVQARNAAGTTEANSGTWWHFTTRDDSATILLVDDDDNNPDIRDRYTDALDALGMSYDIWDTGNSDNEPDATTLASYSTVIWFTGAEWGGFAGPGTAGEAALASFLDDGKCLFVSSQDYLYDRGLTTFMSTYLGVNSFSGDVAQTIVTGTGSVFGGLGPYSLSYPFYNYSDRISPDGTAELAFSGDQGDAAVNKDSGVYRTTFWGFPFEALPSETDRSSAMNTVLDWCSGSVRTIVINEADLGINDAVEFFNFGASPVNMTGWVFTAIRTTEVTSYTFPSFTLASGAYVVLHETSGTDTPTDLYMGDNIYWVNGADGSASLVDAGGQGVDFARWGASTDAPPPGTTWTGTNPSSPADGYNLGRDEFSTDTDDGSDWCSQTSSLGAQNPGCGNTPPTLSGLPNQIFDQTTSLPGTIDLWAYASDAETPDSGLTYTIEGSPPPGAGVTIDSNRYVYINPSADWCGYTDVTIGVTDPGGLWDNDTFRVAVTWSCQG